MFKRSHKVVGIEFTNTGIHIAALEVRAQASEIIATADIELDNGPTHASYLTSGLEPMKSFVKQHQLAAALGVLCVPNQRSVVRCLQMPLIPEKALREVVQVDMGSAIHLPFDNPVYDISPLFPIEGSTEQHVCLVATDKGLAETMSFVVRNAGLKPVAIEIAPLALWRLYQINHQCTGLSLLVDMDAHDVCLSLFVEDKLYFSRTVDLTLSDVQHEQHLFANFLGYEIERVMNFFNFNLADGNRPLERVIFHTYMNQAESDGLVARLEQRLNRSVSLMSVYVRTRVATVEFMPRHYTAVGLALKERY